MAAEPEKFSVDEIASSISCAQFIIIGRLARAVSGPMQLSYPPIRHYNLSFDHLQWYRRTNAQGMQFDEPMTFKFMDNSHDGVKLTEGSRYAIAGNCQEDGVRPVLSVLQQADGEITQLLMEMPSVPVAWKRQVGGGWVYPIEVDRKPAWWAELAKEGALRCARTGRPALLCGNDKILMDVKQIIPADAQEKMAPYGDGEFALSITNTDVDAVTIPALLADKETGAISWEDSILIVDVHTHETFCPPGAGIRQHLVPCTLAPNASVHTVVNCLALKGTEYWRCGGVRVYLLFCLGEMCRENFFYYYSKAHEAKHDSTIGKAMFS